jgi:hypothetical protein
MLHLRLFQVVVGLAAFSVSELHAQIHQWTRQFLTSTPEPPPGEFIVVPPAVSADGLGGAYVAEAAVLTKFSGSGDTLWTQQIDTLDKQLATAVSTDSLGSVFVSGYDNIYTGPAGLNGFLSKYDSLGSLLWSKQFGSERREETTRVSADGLGNVYVAGYTGGDLLGQHAGLGDAFLIKYDSLGNQLWGRQFGTAQAERVHGLSVDGLGNVYIAGTTQGSLGGPNAGLQDLFIRKYDGFGNVLWTRQLGTSDYENNTRVAADQLGNVFVAGSTYQSLAGPVSGVEDAYLLKYGGNGDLIWARQFGSAQTAATDVFVDGLGGCYITGTTNGVLGNANFGSFDVFLKRFDAAGDVAWTHQFGTTTADLSSAVAADSLKNVFVAGSVGSIGGPVFVTKFSDVVVAEPAVTSLVGIAFLTWAIVCSASSARSLRVARAWTSRRSR